MHVMFVKKHPNTRTPWENTKVKIIDSWLKIKYSQQTNNTEQDDKKYVMENIIINKKMILMTSLILNEMIEDNDKWFGELLGDVIIEADDDAAADD